MPTTLTTLLHCFKVLESCRVTSTNFLFKQFEIPFHMLTRNVLKLI